MISKRQEKLVLFYPYVPQEAIDEVNATLKTRWIGQGPKVDLFEKMFEERFGAKHAVSLNSCSAALETALDILDLRPGDEVVTTPFTCTATNLPLVRRGLKLVFADIDPNTLNLSKASVLSSITAKTRLVMNVHLGGIENDLSDIQESFIPVIDDCAQALGIRTNALFSCYSFQAIKHITTGDGGMLTCENDADAAKAKLLRWFGIDRAKKQANDWKAYKEREMVFDIELPGHKRQMTDIAAAMGIGGLKVLDRIMAERKAIFDVYRSIKAPGFKLVDGPNNVYWLAQVLVDRRDDFAKKLAEWNIETNLVQIRNDVYKIFGGIRQPLPVMNDIEDKYTSLPLHNMMTVEDAEYVKEIIQSGW